MGIDIPTTDILDELQENRTKAAKPGPKRAITWYENKAPHAQQSASYEKAQAVCVDINLDAYTWRAYVCAGVVELVFRKLVQPVLDRGHVCVLVCDNSARVPQNKKPTQEKRRRKPPSKKGSVAAPPPAKPKDFPIGDDLPFPTDNNYYHLLSDSAWRRDLFSFVMNGLTDAVREYTRGACASKMGRLYLSDPNGNAWEATRGGPDPPWTSEGEGDKLLKVYSDWLVTSGLVSEDASIVVKSKDKDMLLVYMSSPFSGRVYLHLGDKRRTKSLPTMYRIVDMRALYEDVFLSNREAALHVACALVLGRSDYCEGPANVGGLRILQRFLKSIDKPVVRIVPETEEDDEKLIFDAQSIQGLVHASAFKGRAVTFTQNTFNRMKWNVEYVSRINYQPDPIQSKGWAFDSTGKIFAVVSHAIEAAKKKKKNAQQQRSSKKA